MFWNHIYFMKVSLSPKSKLAKLFVKNESLESRQSPLPRSIKNTLEEVIPRQNTQNINKGENFSAMKTQLTNIKSQVYKLINETPNFLLSEKEKNVLTEQCKDDGSNKTLKKAYRYTDKRQLSHESDKNQQEQNKDGKKTSRKSIAGYRKSVQQFKQTTLCRNCHKYIQGYEKYEMIIKQNKQIKCEMYKSKVELKAKIEFLSKQNKRLNQDLQKKVLENHKMSSQNKKKQQILQTMQKQLNQLKNKLKSKTDENMDLQNLQMLDQSTFIQEIRKLKRDKHFNKLFRQQVCGDVIQSLKSYKKQKHPINTQRSKTPIISYKCQPQNKNQLQNIRQIQRLHKQLYYREMRDKKNQKQYKMMEKKLSKYYQQQKKMQRTIDFLNQKILSNQISILNSKYAFFNE